MKLVNVLAAIPFLVIPLMPSAAVAGLGTRYRLSNGNNIVETCVPTGRGGFRCAEIRRDLRSNIEYTTIFLRTPAEMTEHLLKSVHVNNICIYQDDDRQCTNERDFFFLD